MRNVAVAMLALSVSLLGIAGAPGVRAQTRQAASDPAPASLPDVLLRKRQPGFADLSPQQKFILAPLADQWAEMPETKRRQWIALADRFPKLSAEQQARAQERIQEWAALTSEQRRLARSNYRLARQLGSDARSGQVQQYDTLTDEQKQVLRQAGRTSNTAARHAGAPTALAKEAAKPFPRNAETVELPTDTK